MWQSSIQSWVRDEHGLFTAPIASVGNYSLIKQMPEAMLLFFCYTQKTSSGPCDLTVFHSHTWIDSKLKAEKTEETSYWSLHEPWNFPLVPKTGKDFTGFAVEKSKSRISLFMTVSSTPQKITVSLPMFLLLNLVKLFPLDIRCRSQLLSAKWSQGRSGPNTGSDDKILCFLL